MFTADALTRLNRESKPLYAIKSLLRHSMDGTSMDETSDSSNQMMKVTAKENQILAEIRSFIPGRLSFQVKGNQTNRDRIRRRRRRRRRCSA